MVEREIRARIDQYIKQKLENDHNFDYDGWLYNENKTKKFYAKISGELWAEIKSDSELRERIKRELNSDIFVGLENLTKNIKLHKVFSDTSPFHGNSYVLKYFYRVIKLHIELKKVQMEDSNSNSNSNSNYELEVINLWSKLANLIHKALETHNANLDLDIKAVIYFFNELFNSDDIFVDELIQSLEGNIE